MAETRVLFSDLEQGMQEIPQNCSYLKKSFFDEYPTEKPAAADKVFEEIKK